MLSIAKWLEFPKYKHLTASPRNIKLIPNMKKYKKVLLIIISIAIIVTILAMLADQAVGSCCGSSESANIEAWWWVAIFAELFALIYISKKV
jgi:hypothetical protein